MNRSKGTYSNSISTTTFGLKVPFLIFFINESYILRHQFSKASSKNGRPWKSHKFMFVFKSLRSVNLSDNITESVIFSFFPFRVSALSVALFLKRFFCRTQKYASHENSMILVEVTVIFAPSSQNDHFPQNAQKVILFWLISMSMG